MSKKIKDHYVVDTDSGESIAIPEKRFENTPEEARENPQYWDWTCSQHRPHPLGGLHRGPRQAVVDDLLSE